MEVYEELQRPDLRLVLSNIPQFQEEDANEEYDPPTDPVVPAQLDYAGSDNTIDYLDIDMMEPTPPSVLDEKFIPAKTKQMMG